MSDSLLVCRLFELLGGGVPSQLPQCSGAIFRLGDQYTMGTPQPVVDFVVQLIGDGSKPTGERMDNRTIELPVTIIVPSTGNSVNDRLTLSAAREALFEAINVEKFELVWSPDGTEGNRELVYDCWRAKANVVDFDYKREKQLLSTVTISFEAYPWGRNDESKKIAFDSPIIASNQTPTYQLQDFAGGTNGAAITTANSAKSVAGPFNTAFTSVTNGSGASAVYDNSPVSHGILSALLNAGASNQSTVLAWSAPSSQPQQWFRLFVNLNAAPGATATLMRVLTGGAATIANLKLNTNRTLSMDAGASSNVITTATQIPLNQWVRIEGYVIGDASAGQVSMSLYLSMDSTTAAETQTSAATFNTNGVPATYNLGIVNTGAGVNWNYNLDVPAVGVNGPVGPYATWGSGGDYLTQVTVDDFTSVSSTQQSTWWSQTNTTAPSWSSAARWNHDISDRQSPMWYKHTLAAPVDITGRDKLTFWLGMGVPATDYKLWHGGHTHYAITLFDSSGHQLTFGGQGILRASNNPSFPYWNRISLKILQNSTTFRYESVSSYQIQAWSEQQIRISGKFLHFKTAAYLAGLVATPTAAPRRPASDRGGDYVLHGIEGTAPSNLSLHAQLGFTTFVQSTQSIIMPGTPGVSSNWLAPSENPNWLGADSGDFDEYGTIGTWTGSDGIATNGTLTSSTTQANSAPNSLSVVPVTGGSNVVIASSLASGIQTQGVPCVPGDRISLRANVRAGSTGRSITVGAQFFTSGGAAISRVDLSPVTDTTSGFTLISGRVTAPATSAFCRMVVTITTPAAAEIHYFDDMYLSWALQGTVACAAGGGGGGTARPSVNAGGGGGGGEIAWETNLDLNPAANHAYTVGAGGLFQVGPATKALDGGNSSFAGLSVTVLAHGGVGGTNRITQNFSNGSGGAGGSGSTNGHHFNGGSGATGNVSASPHPTGGGGGGSAGDGGAGNNASGSAPGTGGGSGSLALPGASGGHANDNGGGNGNAGFIYGGGGGGATSTSTRGYNGGNGGQGRIKMVLTTYSLQSNFPCLLVHKPSKRTGNLAQTVIPCGSGVDAPDGREYGIPSVDGFLARYNGTYSVYAVNFSWNGSAARTVTATIKQYEASGGAVSSVIAAQSVTPANINNGMVWLGEVTLPVKDIPAENIDSYFTVSLQSSNSSDRFLDLLLIDTSGQLVLINIPGSGYTDYWVDAPDLEGHIGKVLGSVADRQQAASVLGNTTMSGGPLKVWPGANQFTIYSPTGMPGLAGEYIPHWWLERLY